MTTQCPHCKGAPGAHSITCPTLMSSSGLPLAPVVGTTGACPACGGSGYHKGACPMAMVSRPDPDGSPHPSAHAVIAKVLKVHRDIGHTSAPDAIAAEIIAELIRHDYTIS